MRFIYKICNLREWSTFKKKKKFKGTKKDILDGYIHLSKKSQVKKTLKKYYLKKDKLILLKIKTPKLKRLIWEKSSEGKLFPHLYSFLNLRDVKSTYKIFLNKNGEHSILLKY